MATKGGPSSSDRSSFKARSNGLSPSAFPTTGREQSSSQSVLSRVGRDARRDIDDKRLNNVTAYSRILDRRLDDLESTSIIFELFLLLLHFY